MLAAAGLGGVIRRHARVSMDDAQVTAMPTYPCADCDKPIGRKAKMSTGRCAACARLKGLAGHPTWFGRWRAYPMSCLGHVVQGAIAGALPFPGLFLYAFCDLEEMPAILLSVIGLVIGYVWWRGFEAYQRLSFERKVNTTGRGDTAGLDAYDFIVGYVPASIAGLAVALAKLSLTEG